MGEKSRGNFPVVKCIRFDCVGKLCMDGVFCNLCSNHNRLYHPQSLNLTCNLMHVYGAMIVMYAYQYAYYVVKTPVVDDDKYDKFCSLHGLDGRVEDPQDKTRYSLDVMYIAKLLLEEKEGTKNGNTPKDAP